MLVSGIAHAVGAAMVAIQRFTAEGADATLGNFPVDRVTPVVDLIEWNQCDIFPLP